MEHQLPTFTKPKPSSSSSSNSSSTMTKPLKPQAKKISISLLVISLPVLYVSLLHIPPSTLLRDTTFWFLMSNSIIVIVAADSGVFSSWSARGPTDDLYDEYIRHSKARSSACPIADPPPEAGDKEITSANEQGPVDAALDKNTVEKEIPVLQSSVTLADKSVVLVNEEAVVPERDVAIDNSIVVYEPTSGALQEKPGAVVHEAQVIEENLLPRPPQKAVQKSKTFNENSLSRPATAVDRSVAEKKGTTSPLRRRSSAMEKRHQRTMESEYSKLTDEELNKRVEDFIRSFNREIRLQLRNECVY